MSLLHFVNKAEIAFGKGFGSDLAASEQVFQILFRDIGKAEIGDGKLNLPLVIHYIGFHLDHVSGIKLCRVFGGILPHIGRDGTGSVLESEPQELVIFTIPEFFIGCKVETDDLLADFLM